MNQLKLGLVSWRELSIWFGLKPDSLAKHPKSKEKKLRALTGFADFHIDEKGRVIIDEIYTLEYSKAYEIIERNFETTWDKSMIDTCANVGKKIYNKEESLQAQISISTAKNYTNKVKIEKYGHNFLNDYGSKGHSKHIWIDPNTNKPLTKDQLTILKLCAQEAYNDADETLAAIEHSYRNGEISLREKEQSLANIDTSTGYEKFELSVYENLGFFPNKKTLLINDEECAFYNLEDNNGK